jgi:hypothetical protein
MVVPARIADSRVLKNIHIVARDRIRIPRMVIIIGGDQYIWPKPSLQA